MRIAVEARRALSASAAWARNPENRQGLQLLAATLLITLLVIVRLIHEIVLNPTLVYLPFFVLIGLIVAGLFLILGGLGWLFLRILPALIRLLIQAKPDQKLTVLDMAYGTVLAIFLGVPSISDAVLWWHEHLFKRITGEEATVTWALSTVSGWVTDYGQGALGILILIAFATFLSWKVYQQFETSRAITIHVTSLMFLRRRWLFPVALICALGLTLVAWDQSGKDSWGVAASAEMLVLLLWLISPLLRVYWWLVLFFVAVLGPVFIIDAHLSGRLTGAFVMLFWLFWLVSIFADAWRYWFIPYWLAVGGMAAFMLVDDFYLRVPT